MIMRSSAKLRSACAFTCMAICVGAITGCQQPETADDEEVEASAQACASQAAEGRRLFEQETFGGNGRTCLTCHSAQTGTLSPADVQARFAQNPNDPLFLHDGSDDLAGNGVTRILADATILVEIPLPPNASLAGDPTATSIVVRRGIPTTLNTPSLDSVLMYDGRAPTLEEQALGAISGHAQSTIAPTDAELGLIADHEQSSTFFSSWALYNYANGGSPPSLPMGSTASEKRGRLWFVDATLTPSLSSASPRNGLCASCHSGPMLNQTNGFGLFPLPPFPTAPDATSCDQPATQGAQVPAGRRFDSVLISELNIGNEPRHSLVLELPNGATVNLPPFADPGRALITGDFRSFPSLDGDLFKFKIPTLWGVKKTAPYFHNNSAKTLEELVDHYALFFAITTDCNIDGDPPLIMTDQDKADLVAYLNLL